MGTQNRLLQFSNFSNGMITDLSLTEMPDNAALDIKNMEIQRDGTLKKRLNIGPVLENPEIINKSFAVTEQQMVSSDSIDNVRDNEHHVLVRIRDSWKILSLQDKDYGNQWNNPGVPVPGENSTYYSTTSLQDNMHISYEEADGFYYIAGGGNDNNGNGLYTVDNVDNPQNGSFIDQGYPSPKIRDITGVSTDVNDFITTSFVFEPDDSVYRKIWGSDTPDLASYSLYAYNLWNQGFGLPRFNPAGVNDTPLEHFISAYGGVDPQPPLPSNSESVVQHYYPNPNNLALEGIDVYHQVPAYNTPTSQTLVPKGHFIIEAQNRGPGRFNAINNRATEHPLMLNDNIDPFIFAQLSGTEFEGAFDRGPFYSEAHAGRLFIAGWYTDMEHNTLYNTRSPDLSTWIMYTQLQKYGKTNLQDFFQEGDPTFRDESDLLPTDGGYVKITGSGKLQGIVSIGKSLLIFAEKGVWSLDGGSLGFSATNQRLSKISDEGCISAKSIVLVDDAVYYWSNRDIYRVFVNEREDYEFDNLTKGRISDYYNSFDLEFRLTSAGAYHESKDKIMWVFNNWPYRNGTVPPGEDDDGTQMLVFDLTHQAWTRNVYAEDIQEGEDISFVRIHDLFYNKAEECMNFIVDTDLGQGINGFYIWSEKPDASYGYLEETYPVNAKVVIGNMTGGDLSRDKRVPYLTMQYKNVPTESGTMFAEWDWSKGAISARRTRPQDTFRIDPRIVQPSLYEVFTTKTKIRGKGKTVKITITDDYSDQRVDDSFHIIGWSLFTGIQTNV